MTGEQPRAPRYPVLSELLFRAGTDGDWRRASTVNISRTGVLFTNEGPPPDRDRDVEFMVTLPPDGAGPGPKVWCSGRVVRVEPAGDGGRSTTAVAVTIDEYEILGRRSAPRV